MNPFGIDTPSSAPTERPIQADDFWPPVDPAKVRDSMRIDQAVTPERLRDALIEGIAAVTAQLAAWQATQTAASLADVESTQVDGVSVHVHRYLRAVGCLAKASVLERYRDQDTTAQGDRKADATDPTIDDLYRDAHWAINAIRGQPRTTVELI